MKAAEAEGEDQVNAALAKIPLSAADNFGKDDAKCDVAKASDDVPDETDETDETSQEGEEEDEEGEEGRR